MAEDEGIGSVRDYIAAEIEKRTELLKSIVKSECSSILDASDVINQMIKQLDQVDSSLKLVDRSITEFHTRIKGLVFPKEVRQTTASPHSGNPSQIKQATSGDASIRDFLERSASIWDELDGGNIEDCVDQLNEVLDSINRCNPSNLSDENKITLDEIQTTLSQTRDKIKSDLKQRINSAPPDQIGIIALNDQDILYKLALESMLEFLTAELRHSISDMTFHAKIKRYQVGSLFNCQTNQIESGIDDSKDYGAGLIQIPKSISPELSTFLYKICQSINVIAGLSLTRSSIIKNLEMTIDRILVIYEEILPKLNDLTGETKRRTSLQLYFDLLYVRILLNTSKNIETIEKLDPKITELTSKYELNLDSIELYTISTALHSNIMNLVKSTIRLYGLLIPHLQ